MTRGLARAAGASITVTIGNEVYLLGPLTLGDFGTIENEILKRRWTNPIESVRRLADSAISEETFDRLMTRAYADARARNFATPNEVSEYLDTREGVALSVWIQLRKNHPEIRHSAIERHVESATQGRVDHLILLRDIASGIDEPGNLDWSDFRPKKSETFLQWRLRVRAEKLSRPQSWRVMFRELSEAYFWATPEAISRMTYYQLRAYYSDKTALGGVQKMTPEEAAKKGIT